MFVVPDHSTGVEHHADSEDEGPRRVAPVVMVIVIKVLSAAAMTVVLAADRSADQLRA
jgi:hypothetical protein